MPCRSVHPRACGERRRRRGAVDLRRGSSPRVRGTAPLMGIFWLRRRFIPARAGNGNKTNAGACRHPVHPRACGERGSPAKGKEGKDGSSPRVRGTGRPDRYGDGGNRFIPARAGNGQCPSACRTARSVHPRACGERLVVSPQRRARGGSSPRVRGTARNNGLGRQRQRFIPARAGNGSPARRVPSLSAVHPRACGERARIAKRTGSCCGSSPRVRGTDHPLLRNIHHSRFIPARAGNGTASRILSSREPVHPRACGERNTMTDSLHQEDGSSPRVRGTACRSTPGRVVIRFIPRACGERPLPNSTKAFPSGSSPRVRGTDRSQFRC